MYFVHVKYFVRSFPFGKSAPSKILRANSKKLSVFSNAIKYITELKSLVVDGRDKYASTTELESAIDDILSLIDSTLYKLKELK